MLQHQGKTNKEQFNYFSIYNNFDTMLVSCLTHGGLDSGDVWLGKAGGGCTLGGVNGWVGGEGGGTASTV